MWKDFFYYSKSERRAVTVLLVLIAVLLVGIVVMPDPEPQPPGREAVEAADRLTAESARSRKERTVGANPDFPAAKKHFALAPFDPNAADSIELSALGLPVYVVRNILKYRLKGGRFDRPDDLARIYGLTSEKFAELRSYIRIPEAYRKRKPKASFTDRVKPYKYPAGTLVDVATADTSELRKIPGIGAGISRAIVRHRERLGGFVRLEQLKEVKYVTDEMLEWFTLSVVPIRKIPMNSADMDELRAHPYLNYSQAKVIIEHRRKQGKLKSLSQLSLYEEFAEKDLVRLADYADFD